MPRAENRKKPPGQSGKREGVWNKPSNAVTGLTASQSASNKKQELLEKMKKIQESKKADPTDITD